MKNNQINKFFKRLLTTVLTVSLATIPALSVAPTLTVHADMEYQGGEGGKAEGGKHHYTDGVSQNKSGLFVYTLDADGSVTNDTPIIILNKTQYAAWQNGAYKTEPIKTRFDDGGEDKIKTITLDIPNVIIHQNNKWTSNWHAIREYWDGKESDPTDEGAKGKFIEFMRQKGLWSEAIKMYDNGEPFYIAIETIAWSGKFVNGKSEGKLASTAAGWAKFYKDKGMTYSDSSMKSFYSAALPFSLTLDRTMFGWSVPNTLSGYVTNDDIRNKGYGMNFILVNGSTGHSIVTPTPAPADVESETPTNYSVIKVYERENPETKEIVSEGSYITTNAYSDLTVNEEEGWKIISVETVSPQIKTIGSNDVYEVVKGDTTTKQVYDPDSLPISVTLSPTEPTLIVRYRATGLELPPVRLTGTHTVPEQRITQSYRDTLVNSLTFVKNKISKEGDDHHRYKDGCGDKDHKCPGHDCDYDYSANKKVTDSKYTIKVYDENMKKENLLYALSNGYNQYGSGNNKAIESKFNAFYTTQNFSSDSNQRRYPTFNVDSATGLGGINFTYNVTRHKTDTLTLCSYSKDVQGYTDNKVELVNLYGMKVGNKPLGNRKKEDYIQNLSYSLKQDRDTVDIITKGKYPCEGDCDGTKYSDEGSAESILNVTNTANLTIAFQTYSGKNMPAGTASVIPITLSSGNGEGSYITSPVSGRNLDNVYGVTVSNGSVSLYPFVEMNFNRAQNIYLAGTDDNINAGVSSPAYVLSEYLRTINTSDYAQVSYKYHPRNQLEIKSTQFSKNARATQQGYDWNGKYVLPGGATYNLTNADSPQKVNIETVHVLVEDTLKNNKVSGGDEQLESRAIVEFNQLEANVVESLEKLNVQQIVGFSTSGQYAWSGEAYKVYEGASFNGQTLSTDAKYYLRESSASDGTTRDTMIKEADFDVTPGAKAAVYYGVYTDTAGNLWITNKTNSLQSALRATGGTKLATKTEGLTKVLQNATAKYLDDRTKLFTNICKAIERNSGNDTNASIQGVNIPDGKWYNEAIPRFVVMVQYEDIGVTFKKTPTRMTVLDPKVTPINTGVADLFTKAYSMQYRCNDYYGTRDNNTDIIGRFRGQNLKISNLSNLIYSNKVYVPNATVDDLSSY